MRRQFDHMISTSVTISRDVLRLVDGSWIEAAILSLAQPRCALSEREMADWLGVSQTGIHKAKLRLIGRGFVEIDKDQTGNGADSLFITETFLRLLKQLVSDSATTPVRFTDGSGWSRGTGGEFLELTGVSSENSGGEFLELTGVSSENSPPILPGGIRNPEKDQTTIVQAAKREIGGQYVSETIIPAYSDALKPDRGDVPVTDDSARKNMGTMYNTKSKELRELDIRDTTGKDLAIVSLEKLPAPVVPSGFDYSALESIIEADAAAGKPKGKRTRKPVSVDAKQSLFPIASALAEVCGVDFETNRGRLFKQAALLSKSPVQPSPAIITENYSGDQSYWYKYDWRGKKGQRPSIEQVGQTWGMWRLNTSVKSDRLLVEDSEIEKYTAGLKTVGEAMREEGKYVPDWL